MVDCSHSNSQKMYQRQIDVAREVARQVAAGEDRVIGLMVESHLKAGRQDLVPGKPLIYGQSITDACIGGGQRPAAQESRRGGPQAPAGESRRILAQPGTDHVFSSSQGNRRPGIGQ